ncbi:hypothetical protein SKAU_G00127860 [Synaphobranchus kaupii]|uniref:Uncharacterized protein n=1 Tax=Synaphobranchus kaupii TaxID=118154 RepID=A0A9Q1FPT4_SYNKA|nr:hypothetical protein SKAU_G00127860 [Synaphobranchus kaupii]
MSRVFANVSAKEADSQVHRCQGPQKSRGVWHSSPLWQRWQIKGPASHRSQVAPDHTSPRPTPAIPHSSFEAAANDSASAGAPAPRPRIDVTPAGIRREREMEGRC